MTHEHADSRILVGIGEKIVDFFSSSASLAIFFGLTAVVRLIYFSLMWSLPMSGDEDGYFTRSAHVLNLVGIDVLGGISASQSADVVVGQGRFLPGMSVVLAPIRIFTDSVAVHRLGIGLLNLLVLLLLVLLVRKCFGTLAASLSLVVLGLFPRMIAFSFVFWGDYLGGHLLVILLLLFWNRHMKIATGEPVGMVRPWIGPALLLTALIYIRLNVVFFVPVIVLFIFMMFWNVHRFWSAALHAVVPVALTVSLLIAGLAPWSYAVSAKHGGFYPLTVQGDLAQIVNLGRPGDVAAAGGPAGERSVSRWYNYIDELAESEGTSFHAVAKRERSRIVGRSNYSRYYATVRDGLQRYFQEFGFLNRFKRLTAESSPERASLITNMFGAMRVPNFLIWYGLLWTAIVLMFVPISPSYKNWWLAFLLKMVFVASMVPAFLGGLLGERRGVILPPILVVSAAILVATRPAIASRLSLITSHVDRFVWLVQAGLGVLFVAGFAFYFQTYLFGLL